MELSSSALYRRFSAQTCRFGTWLARYGPTMSKSPPPAEVPGTRTNTLVADGEPNRRTVTWSYLAGVPVTATPLTRKTEVGPSESLATPGGAAWAPPDSKSVALRTSDV